MKNLIKATLLLMTVTMLFATLPTDAEAEIYQDTVRLHILANSDSNEDQALKLEIRDKILLEYGEILRAAGSYEKAKETVGTLLPEIEKTGEFWIQELGYSYDVKAILTEEWYETREYDDFRLPCGIYTSLKIIIGEGEGKNWWCVMYPPLCTELSCENAASDDAVIDYTKEEVFLIKSKKYNIKFKVLEDLSRVFTKNG